MLRFASRASVVLLILVLLPSAVYPQASAAITGVVRDASGAVLPGVTVEAASPVLIEKTRSVVSDGTGQYRIVALPPGTYTVTFTLPGFSTVKRDGIELTGSFVATVNGDLKVGSLEETITVSGETPVVDVQGVRQQQTVSKETLAVIPTSRMVGGLLNLLPGVFGAEPDVGGSKGAVTSQTWGGAVHGGKTSEGRLLADGYPATYQNLGGGQYMAQSGTAQETVVNTSGNLGEADTSGVMTNIIPREGGNAFSGSFFLSGTNDKFQGNNYSQELKDAGLTTPPNAVMKVYDFNPSGGGRIIRDKLWFYLTYRDTTSYQTVSGMYFNKNAGDITKWNYEPDLNRQAFFDNIWRNASVRPTWQATPRNKFTVYWDWQWRSIQSESGGTALSSPEATGREYNNPSQVWQTSWSSPISNRLLVEAGTGTYEARWRQNDLSTKKISFTPGAIQVLEQAGSIPGLVYRNPPSSGYNTIGTHTWKASASYVTGAHSAKFGYFGAWIDPTTQTFFYQEINQYRFSNGEPNQFLMQGANPLVQQRFIITTAFYAQDQWTTGRLTLQGGVRYDHQRTKYGRFATNLEKREGSDPRRFINPPIIYEAGATGGVNFRDITPRMGGAYDLFGNGKTAIKANLGKFPMAQSGTANHSSNDLSPVARLALNTTRSWTDSNKNYVPDCELTNRAKNGECGAMANQNFGVNKFDRTFDPAVTEGWGNRNYTWEGGVSVQHEVVPRVSVNVGYYYQWYGNFFVTDNLAVTAADYDQFFIKAPLDPRLPDGGGQTIGPLYDVKANKFGASDNYVTPASNFGKQIERWKGWDVTVNARMQNGLTVQGGTSTGRTVTDNCEIRAKLPEISPTDAFCHVAPPYLTGAKGFAAYTIPRWDVQLSGTFQSRPWTGVGSGTGTFNGGLPYQFANRNVPNAEIQPILGRPLSGGLSNIPVNQVKAGTVIPPRFNQIDIRVAKILRFDNRRLQLAFDLYNLTNTDVPISYNQTYILNGAWLTPTEILPARLGKFSVQFDW